MLKSPTETGSRHESRCIGRRGTISVLSDPANSGAPSPMYEVRQAVTRSRRWLQASLRTLLGPSRGFTHGKGKGAEWSRPIRPLKGRLSPRVVLKDESPGVTTPAPRAPPPPSRTARSPGRPAPCRFTRANISRAIATPSASAASLPFSCACAHPRQHRLGDGHARHLVRQELGVAQADQRPDARHDRDPDCSTRFRNASSWRGSNTGCVTANSAPASTFQSKRDSSRSRSTAAGFTPTPITQRVGRADRIVRRGRGRGSAGRPGS